MTSTFTQISQRFVYGCVAAIALLGGWTLSYAQSKTDTNLPDATLTPGDTLAVTAKDVCTPGYAGKIREVSKSVKESVYKAYSIETHKSGEYEIDHLISLELGGSNSTKNLWPQPYLTKPWNAHVKDKLENYLHDEVCDGNITLKQAQDDLRTDWTATYTKVFGTPPNK